MIYAANALQCQNTSMPAAKTVKYSSIFSDSCIAHLSTSQIIIGNALV